MSYLTRLPVVIFLSVAVVAGFAWWVNATKNNGSIRQFRLDYKNQQTVELGRKIYVRQCAACHGRTLEGQKNWRARLPNGRLPAPPHDETGHTWHHSDQQLFLLTKYGPQPIVGGDYQSDMPAYKDMLSDDHILAVLAFIKSTWPPEIQARHDQISLRAEQQNR